MNELHIQGQKEYHVQLTTDSRAKSIMCSCLHIQEQRVSWAVDYTYVKEKDYHVQLTTDSRAKSIMYVDYTFKDKEYHVQLTTHLLRTKSIV